MTLQTLANVATEGVSGPWAAASAFTVLVITQLGKQLTDWRRDKRELESDLAKRQALCSIADTNQRLLIQQMQTHTTLVSQNTIQAERHTALLGALNSVCKKEIK